MKGYTKKLQLDFYVNNEHPRFMTIVEQFNGKRSMLHLIGNTGGYGADTVSYEFKDMTMLVSFPVMKREIETPKPQKSKKK